MIELRPYQHECIEAIETAEKEGTKRPLVALPTGTGKDHLLLYGGKKAQRTDTDISASRRTDLTKGEASDLLSQIFGEQYPV